MSRSTLIWRTVISRLFYWEPALNMVNHFINIELFFSFFRCLWSFKPLHHCDFVFVGVRVVTCHHRSSSPQSGWFPIKWNMLMQRARGLQMRDRLRRTNGCVRKQKRLHKRYSVMSIRNLVSGKNWQPLAKQGQQALAIGIAQAPCKVSTAALPLAAVWEVVEPSHQGHCCWSSQLAFRWVQSQRLLRLLFRLAKTIKCEWGGHDTDIGRETLGKICKRWRCIFPEGTPGEGPELCCLTCYLPFPLFLWLSL